METPVSPAAEEQWEEGLPPLQLHAFLTGDRHQLLRYMPGALSASGAWMLRHETSYGTMRFYFEFERSNGMNIYVMIVGLGLELTRTSHLALTSFCQRTLNLPQDAHQVTSCELEISDLLEDPSSNEPFFGANSTT